MIVVLLPQNSKKKKLTSTSNNSAGRQEFFEVNVIFQIDNLHDPDNQLPQQQQRQFYNRAHASKPLQKCKSRKVRQASIICKGMYPPTRERTPSSLPPPPPKRPPRAMNRSLERVFRAPRSLFQIQKLAFWRPTAVNGRHRKKISSYQWRTIYVVLLAYVRLIILSLKPVFRYSPKFQLPNMSFTRHGDPNGRNLERWYVMMH